MTTPKTTRKTRTPAGSAAIKTKKIVKRVELPPNPFIHEILDHVEEQKTKAKKITELRKYRDDSLTCLLYTSPSPRDQRGSRMAGSG